MELLEAADEKAFLWLNGWVGRFPWLDSLAQLVVSDYLVPLVLSLTLLGLWFTGADAIARLRNQHGVIVGIIALGLASVVLDLFNVFLFRPRPFSTLPVSLLFYQPTDSSFPSHPAIVGFSLATGVWLWNRRVGAALLVAATLYALARVYSGVAYPLDILGGAAIGAGAALIGAFVLRCVKFFPELILRIARSLYLA